MRIIRLQEVMATTGLARSTIYKLISESTFPKPVPLGGDPWGGSKKRCRIGCWSELKSVMRH